jgi:hypothetical protein
MNDVTESLNSGLFARRQTEMRELIRLVPHSGYFTYPSPCHLRQRLPQQ